MRFPAGVPASALTEEERDRYRTLMDLARRRWPTLARSASYRDGLRRRLIAERDPDQRHIDLH